MARRITAVIAAAILVAACGSSVSKSAIPSTSTGGYSSSALCRRVKDSAEKAGASFFARSPAHRYPTTIADLSGTNRQSFYMDALSGTAAISSFLESPHAIKGEGWTLTMSGGGAGPPKFRCT
jgi:hypothetical protein